MLTDFGRVKSNWESLNGTPNPIKLFSSHLWHYDLKLHGTHNQLAGELSNRSISAVTSLMAIPPF